MRVVSCIHKLTLNFLITFGLIGFGAGFRFHFSGLESIALFSFNHYSVILINSRGLSKRILGISSSKVE